MSEEKSGGVSLWLVVQIVFIILKCTKLIDWSWCVVLIPLWIHLGACLILLILVALCDEID